MDHALSASTTTDTISSDQLQGKHAYKLYQNSTYLVISKVAYLIGVPRSIFENEHEPPQLQWYEALEKDRNARIIRNLCMLRTAIEQRFRDINQAMRFELKNLYSLPQYIPQECLAQLSADGITIYRPNAKLSQYVIDLNNHISNRINNCKGLFPIWLKWDYIRKLFIMPRGTTEAGTKAAAAEYYAHKNTYPYQVYLNWAGSLSAGNILYNDKKFVTLLYELNEDYFTDLSKVSDAGQLAKDGIYSFLERSRRTAIVVDCENSDPYKLCATLNNLDQAALLGKIAKIILYDDIHTTSAWAILERFTQIPIEHNLIERIKENKSLVDIRLTTGTCREFFQNDTDSFILASSDSDYWGLISAMPEAHFLVLVEGEKCGPSIKRAMIDAGITYCYMDDFCTGNSEDIKLQTVLGELKRSLAEKVELNILDLLDDVCRRTRADMSTAERQQFYDRYIKPMRLAIDPDGTVRVQLGPL